MLLFYRFLKINNIKLLFNCIILLYYYIIKYFIERKRDLNYIAIQIYHFKFLFKIYLL